VKKNIILMPFNYFTVEGGAKVYDECTILDAAGREIGSLKIGQLYTSEGNIKAYKELRAGNRVIGTIILGGEND
jgi:hypothetical protein